MAHYRHNKHNFKKKKRAYRLRSFALGFSAIVVVAVVGIVIDRVLNELRTPDQNITQVTRSSVQSASVSVNRTDYFQFRAPDGWVFVLNKSTDNKFVYFKKDGPLVTERLIVFLNRGALDYEADMPFTHVLPVEITGSKLKQVGNVSNHCGDDWPVNEVKPNARIEVERVQFFCHRDSKQYNVIAGELYGNEVLDFGNASSKEVDMTIVYSNLTAYQGPGDMYNIIETFEAL